MIVGALIQEWCSTGHCGEKAFVTGRYLRGATPSLSRPVTSSGSPLWDTAPRVVAEVIQNVLASLFGPGTVSALRLATRIIDGFAGLLASGVVVAVMPWCPQPIPE